MRLATSVLLLPTAVSLKLLRDGNAIRAIGAGDHIFRGATEQQ